MHWNLCEDLEIEYETLQACVREIGHAYVDSNPYHSALHAADVLHATHMLAFNTDLVELA
jgi:hypothetical protein